MPGNEIRYQFIPKAAQQEAVLYVLGEGSQPLEIHSGAKLLRNLEPVGGLRQVDAVREGLMNKILSGH